jgi:hypothetical protein
MQRIVRILVLICVMTEGTSAVPAASLSLTADNITWAPAVSGSVRPSMLIGLLKTQTHKHPDLLAGWQLNLKLQPLGAATGTLQFNSATLPAANYLLEGNSAGLLTTIDAAGTTLIAIDDDDTLPLGVPVPASGKGLLSLNFTTPNSALGTFQLIALPPPGGFTQWSDATPTDRFFTNVPSGSTSPIVLATITLVPEPSTIVMAGLAALLLASKLGRRTLNSP